MEDYDVKYEILDSNGKSKSDREREQKKSKKKMTRTHRIVKDEEQRRLNEFRQKIIDRQSTRYKKKLADELNSDLEKKLAVINFIWITSLFFVGLAYCVHSGYKIPFLSDSS